MTRRPVLVFPDARALIFDLDGTLVDSYAAIAGALNFVLRDRGLPARSDPEVRAAIGHGLSHLLGQFLRPEDVPAGVSLFEREYRRTFLESTVALPGVEPTVALLFERGFGLSVASNKPPQFSREILEHLRLSRYLTSVRGPESGIPPKPHPAMLRACLADLKVAPAAALYVGDMVLDVDSGREAGIPVALVATGSSPRRALEETGCPVMDDLGGLPGHLRPHARTAGAR